MRGSDAEDLVAAWLRKRGARILARNHRAAGGEVDLVVEWKGVVCVVEVRARGQGALVGALESVDLRKRRRIERVARAFLARRGGVDRPVRFDVAAVEGGSVRYVEDAWRLEG